jgi:hypothetical protein
MQYSWSILIIAITVLGGGFSLIGYFRNGRLGSFLLKVLFTCGLIISVVAHNIFWERFVNEYVSKGWTLLYTLPTAGACILLVMFAALSISLYWLFRKRSKKFRP